MRALLCGVLLCAACSYDAEKADVTLRVDGIPNDADHLDVVVTPSDATVTGKNCGSNVSATNATCYRPSFQPVETGSPLRSIDMAFAAPATAGTFTVSVTAASRDCPSVCVGGGLATGTVSGTLPGPVDLHVTLQ